MDKDIQDEIAKFPAKFGLRAFPGDTFQISPAASFKSGNQILLYVYIQQGNGWAAFSKGTPAELRSQIVPLAKN